MTVTRIRRSTRRFSLRLEEKKREARFKKEEEYWRQVWESDGFDIDHLKRPSLTAMRVFKCEPDDYPVFLHLYAKMGLHRYNMLQGTNLQLHHIEKYNRYFQEIPSGYFITLVAKDPSMGSLVTFQTSIHESSFNEFDVKCFVARPKSKETKCTLWDDETAPTFEGCTAPKWPSGDALANKNRFYVVQESELKQNDWIRLYMELAFVTTDRLSDKHQKLSDLKIVEVVVETRKIVNPPNEKLKGPKNALIYIEYEQDSGEGQFRRYRARIRRSVDLRTGRLSLVGQNEKVISDKRDQYY